MSEHQAISEKISIEQLRSAISGQVVAPDDSGYDKARTIFPGGIDKRPAAIVQVANVSDIAHVIALARETGVDLTIRSGGHSIFAVNDGGLVLDLVNLKGLEIDAEQQTAWAETGLTAGEVTTAAGEHNLAVGFGDTGSVGIGGITVGGGVGFLVRKYGLTVDDVLSAEIVTADGQHLTVDAENHPDLFWAIRGGGGNFGVVTRFKYRLHKVDQAVGGMLFLPANAEIVAKFVALAEAAPEELSTIANVMGAPPMPFIPEEVHGKPIIMAMMLYAGDAEAGERALAPFRALATPLMDMLRPMKYAEMYQAEEGDYHPVAAGRSMFIDTVDQQTAELIMAHLEKSNADMKVAQIRVLGGAMARVPSDATAFAHRNRRIMVNLAALYSNPEDAPTHEKWVSEFMDALSQGAPDVYVNFLADETPERIQQAYSAATWEKLRAIKAKYDPANVFRLNQNIPPAS